MKRERALSFLLGLFTAVILAFGGGMAIATGFDMNWSWPVLLGFCFGFSLLAAFAAQLRWGSVSLLAAAAIAAFLLRGIWLPSMEVLLNRITSYFHSAYGFPVIQWSEELPEAKATIGLCLVCLPVIFGVCHTVCRRKSAAWGLVPGILYLAVCMVVTDSVPDSLAIFLMVTAFLLLILPQTVRRRNRKEGLRLTAWLLLPCCLLSGLLFCAVPRKGYEAPVKKLQETLVNWFWSLPFMPEPPQGPGIVTVPITGLTASLSDVGQKSESHFPVLEVTAPRTEILYLRGQAYEYYDGLNWIAPDAELADDGWPSGNVSPVGSVKIRTMGLPSIRYFPYYISKQQLQSDMVQGALANAGYALSYSFQMQEASGGGTLSKELRSRCLTLPAASEEKLLEFLETQVLTMPAEELTQAQIVEHIQRYVSQFAVYDLNTDRMPEGQTDFALWFLTQGETGYCVHYATAAAALLRAAGIPARYVTGYAAAVYEDTPVEVLSKDAHAWVEYFDEDKGWVILDATPPEGQPEPPLDIPPETTDATEPTGPSTQPEMPTLPDLETTGPNQETTRPDRPTLPGPTQGTTEAPEQQGPRAKWLLPVLLGLAAAAALAGLVWGQYVLRCWLRRRRLQKLPPNRRAVTLWRRAKFYGWLTRQRPPAQLKALADKAVFSQHTLTVEELREYTRWLRHAEQILREKPCYWLKKLFWALDN